MKDEKQDYKTEILIRLTKIETILESFKKAEEKAQENLERAEERSTEALNLSKDNEKRLDKIEDNIRWLFRTALGAIITGLIGIALACIR